MVRKFLPWLSVPILLASTFGGPAAQERQPNILLLISDDIGVEQFPMFGIGAEPASTPKLDALAARGMRFSRVWAQAMCSPTRATIIAGRYGFRTGVGLGVRAGGFVGPYPEAPERAAGTPTEVYEDIPRDVRPYLSQYSDPALPGDAAGLPLDELTLPAQLKLAAAPYSTAVIGKWHLADSTNGWLEHPGRAGFDQYSVLMVNAPESFYAWWENVDGTMEERRGYTPGRKIDDALDWIGAQGDEPWFLWLAFNLAHYPHHVPDVEELDTSATSPADPRAALDVMVARLDQEIGRLLEGIDDETLDNTVVVFVGDNGTTGNSIDPPFHQNRAKFTIYEGGLRVPLIIAGPGIPQGAASNALVNTTDLYATILELAGAPVPQDRPMDSVSLLPYFDDPARPSLRSWLYADQFDTEQGVENGGYAVRDDRYKLVKIRERTELYDLTLDLGEASDLLEDGISDEERAILSGLQEIVSGLHDSER